MRSDCPPRVSDFPTQVYSGTQNFKSIKLGFLLWSWVLIVGLLHRPSSLVRPRMLCLSSLTTLAIRTNTRWRQRVWYTTTTTVFQASTVVSSFHLSTSSSPIGRDIHHPGAPSARSGDDCCNRALCKRERSRLFSSKNTPAPSSFSVPAMGTDGSINDVSSARNGSVSYTEYEKWVRRLYATNMFHPVKLGLTNMRRLHKLLGDPMDDVRILYFVWYRNAIGVIAYLMSS